MCTRPISIVRKYGNITTTKVVPCGKCSECLKKKQSGYVTRCIEECRKFGRVWFITLTYSEQSCPVVDLSENSQVRTLRREDVKKWKREVRATYLKKYGVPFPKFSFIICGEYGCRSTHRPHYHGLLIGLDLKHSQILEDAWQRKFGFTTFKPICVLPSFGKDDVSCVARYVSKYCVKPASLYKWLPSVCEKPRVMTSPGFGLPDDFDRFKKYVTGGRSDLSVGNLTLGQVNIINDRCKYSYNGCDYALPLYLRKKIFYEKGLNGNLRASSLSKICTATLRSNTLSDFNRELQQLVSGKDEREAVEMVSQILAAEKDDFKCREDFADKDLLRYYQKSKF